MDMVIVESKAKAKTIQKYLGRNFIVVACMGHVQDLPSDSSNAMWASSEGSLPQPPWSWTPKAEAVIDKMLKRAVERDVKRVFIATDLDREGEFIAWRLAIIFSEAGYQNIRRVTFNAITKTAVKEALTNSGDVDDNLVGAAIVRRLTDRLVGFRASKFARSWNIKSLGRVQTPTCGFIVERELEREAFVPVPYFALQAEASGLKYAAIFHHKDDEDAWRNNDGRFNAERTSNRTLVAEAFAAIDSTKELTIFESTPSSRSSAPKPAFTTDTLLQSASSMLKWGVARTTRTAQQLYNAGHITYMRTDSTRTDPSARATARRFITTNWNVNHLGDAPGPGAGGSGGKNVQDAHEAIRPTKPDIASVEGDADGKLLYQLVRARFLATQMSNARFTKLKLGARTDGCDNVFVAEVEWRTHAGWEAAYAGIDSRKRLTEKPDLDLMPGAVYQLDSVEDNPHLIEDATKPPARFRQATLVAHMKKSGIGRPSTYVPTITKIFSRDYCVAGERGIEPTQDGRTLWLDIAPHYDSGGADRKVSFVFSAEFTADMEARLDSVETGERDAADVWHGFLDHFKRLHAHALEVKARKPTPKQMNLFLRLWDAVDESRQADLQAEFEFSTADEISGPQMKELLDLLTSEAVLPPSEPQLKYLESLIGQFDGDLSAVMTTLNIASIETLTGGRKGTASQLIEILSSRVDEIPRPASEKQIKFISNLAEKAKLDESAACALVELEDFASLTGGREGSASRLINLLKRKTGGGRRRKSKASRS